MDDVDDDTMVMFTAQQVVRMRTALEAARADLGTRADGNLMATPCGCLSEKKRDRVAPSR